MAKEKSPSLIRDLYDRWASSYDQTPNSTRDVDARVTRQMLESISAHNVLEIGCGTGKHTSWLGDRFPVVVAIDFSSAMLKEARAKIRSANISFLRADVQRAWPMKDGQFDLIVSTLILEHLPQLDFFFREAFRILNHDGYLYISELHPFKQLQGVQATLPDDRLKIPAFYHPISEYLNMAISVGFLLKRMEESEKPVETESNHIPHIISFLFIKTR